MIIPRIVSDFAGHNGITLKKVNVEEMKKDKNLEKTHPTLSTPYLKLESGEIISTHSGISTFIARTNENAKLFGNGVF